MELLPVRCYTCAKVLGNLQVAYEEEIASQLARGVDPDKIKLGEIMSKLGIYRECCRTSVLNPGVYVSEGYQPSTRVVRAVKKPPPILDSRKILTSISSGQNPTVQKPPERPERPEQPSRREEYRPVRKTSQLESAMRRQPSIPSQSIIPSQSTLPSVVSPRPQVIQPQAIQAPQISRPTEAQVILPPLNLEGIDFQSLGDIEIPSITYL